jgi:hypothetical protein
MNQALSELREVEATAEDVINCARVYRDIYQGATLTPQALVANWPDLMMRARPVGSYDPAASMERALTIVEPAALEAPIDDGSPVGDWSGLRDKMESIGEMPENVLDVAAD